MHNLKKSYVHSKNQFCIILHFNPNVFNVQCYDKNFVQCYDTNIINNKEESEWSKYKFSVIARNICSMAGAGTEDNNNKDGDDEVLCMFIFYFFLFK